MTERALYDASQIEVLDGMEAVRRRPAMYIGSTGADGVRHLAVEILQNSVDEALAARATKLEVTLLTDGTCTVRDDGRGIPVGAHAVGGSALEVVATKLHAGGKFSAGRSYTRPGGLHGMGLAVVNALSASMMITVERDGGLWSASFARGRVVEPTHRFGDSAGHGTTVTFRPDPEIFGDASIDPAFLTEWLRAQCYLLPGLEVELRTVNGLARFQANEGLPDFVRFLAGSRECVHPQPIHIQTTLDGPGGLELDVALLWTRAFADEIRSFVNQVPTLQGGTHVDGLRSAVARVVEHYAVAHHLLDPGESLAAYDAMEGLVAVVAVRMDSPEFGGQTKTQLTTESVAGQLRQAISAHLQAWMDADAAGAAQIVGRAVEAARARAASRRASERARYQRVDLAVDKEVYRQQFGIRSKNWHDSARWITDSELLGLHGGSCVADEGAVVLDICCGSGVVGASFKGRVKKVIGLDLTPEMIALAKTRLDEVVQADVYDIPFDANTFDVVCNREVLHLLPHPERPVSEVFRVLKPGGQFIVGQLVPYGAADAPWFFRVLKKKQPLFFNNFLDEDMRALLTGAGFTGLTVREYVQWEDIETWITTWETPSLQRHQIRDLYHHAPAEVRAVHPFEIAPDGRITDAWRWCVYSCFKPTN